jgi:RNA polymerase sigma factor (sigma-70 family)
VTIAPVPAQPDVLPTMAIPGTFKLEAVAYWIVGRVQNSFPRVDRDELLESVYWLMAHALRTYKPSAGCSLVSWVYYVASRGMRSDLRRKGEIERWAILESQLPSRESDDSEPSDNIFETQDKELEQAGRFAEVCGLIKGLPVSRRRAIELHYLEGRTFEQAGSQLGVSGARARQLVESGLDSLRGMIRHEQASALVRSNLGPGRSSPAVE